MPDGGGRLLKLREGHNKPPTKIRFYGSLGTSIISAGNIFITPESPEPPEPPGITKPPCPLGTPGPSWTSWISWAQLAMATLLNTFWTS